MDVTSVDRLLASGREHALAGRCREAEDELVRALANAKSLGPAVYGRACGSLGTFYGRQGRHFEAVLLYRRALACAREGGDRGLELRSLSNLGAMFVELGLHDRLPPLLGAADDVIATLGREEQEDGEALVLWLRWHVVLRGGDLPAARALLEPIGAFMRSVDDPGNRCLMISWEAELLSREGRDRDALALLRRAEHIRGLDPAYRLDVAYRRLEALEALGEETRAQAAARFMLFMLEPNDNEADPAEARWEVAFDLGRRFENWPECRDLAFRAYDIAAAAVIRRMIELAACVKRVPELACDGAAEERAYVLALRAEHERAQRAVRDRVVRLLEDAGPDHPLFVGGDGGPLLRVCAWCDLVGTRDGTWIPVAHFVAGDGRLDVTHGICPSCQQGEQRRHVEAERRA